MTRQDGFSLIELLVVIVLLGLLTSIAVGVAGGGSQLSTEELTLTCLAPLPLELQLTAIGCTRVVTGVSGCNRG